jgi:hypothetical protein
MKCEYKDGLRVDYSGSLRVRKGNEIEGFLVKEEFIPDTFRYVLDKAVRNNSCGDIRKIAEAITHSVNGKFCIRE